MCLWKGGVEQSRRQRNGVLFVCLYWWELSRLCLIIVVIVCVWEWVIFFCNCSSIGEMTPRLTPERPNENVPHRPNPRQTWRKVFFVCYYLQFFCFSSAIFVSHYWFVSCEPEISPRFSYSLLFYFLFSLEKTAFGFLFVLLSASFSYSSNQYLNY